MRIVGGEWRGRPIEAPRGREVSRPTTDRVREAVASMLDSALPQGICGSRALDAFAGSGALGIELLSRGALHATFFDLDRAAAALVRRNLVRLGCDSARSRVVCGDVLMAVKRGPLPGAPFDVVLIDAPYALGARPAEELLGSLIARKLLAPGALAVFERASDTCPPQVNGLERIKEKRYGRTCIDLLEVV